MLPSIRYVEQCATSGHDRTRRDSDVQMPPIRAAEQSATRAHVDERRDSVMHMPSVRLEKRRLDLAHAGKPHDTVSQRMLNDHQNVQSLRRSPVVDRRGRVSIKDLLLASPAASLIETTNTKLGLSSPTLTMQSSPKKSIRNYAFRTTVKARAIYQTIFPRPKLPAMPPSTETLAPGTHLYEDSKRWPKRDGLDRDFVKRLAVNDINSFRPPPVIHAPSLLALLQAVTAMTKQTKKSRRRCKAH
ncbi:hypothetical protein LTR81_028056 [Elasticomyces elasticus]